MEEKAIIALKNEIQKFPEIDSGTQKINAILSVKDIEKTWCLLPAEEAFYIIKDIGLENAVDLIRISSDDQITRFIDLDCWKKYKFDVLDYGKWLTAIAVATPDKLASFLKEGEAEPIGLFIMHLTRIHVVEESIYPDLPDTAEGLITPDNQFLIEITRNHWAIPLIRTLILTIYAELGVKDATSLINRIRDEMFSDLEERAYGFRASRMEEMGFMRFDEAFKIFSIKPVHKISAEIEKQIEKTYDFSYLEMLKTHRAGLHHLKLERESFFTKTLNSIDDNKAREEILTSFAVLVNSILMTGKFDVGELESFNRAGALASSWLNLGLEYISSQNLEKAQMVLISNPCEIIFNLSFNLLRELKKTIEKMPHHGNGFKFEGVREGLMREHFEFYQGLDLEGVYDFRHFNSLHDVKVSSKVITENAVILNFLVSLLKLSTEDLSEVKGLFEKYRFTKVFLTILAQNAFKGIWKFEQIEDDGLKTFIRLLNEGKVNEVLNKVLANLPETAETKIIKEFIESSVKYAKAIYGNLKDLSSLDKRFIDDPDGICFKK